MRWLELKIPPPAVIVLIGAAMWLAADATGRTGAFTAARTAIATALILLGIGVIVSGDLAFRHARTTINPLRPESASALVVDGIYRRSRNPMYLGLATALLGWAIYLGAAVALLGPPLLVAYLTRFQIIPEERVLARKFGDDYEAYRRRVRRWI